LYNNELYNIHIHTTLKSINGINHTQSSVMRKDKHFQGIKQLLKLYNNKIILL